MATSASESALADGRPSRQEQSLPDPVDLPYERPTPRAAPARGSPDLDVILLTVSVRFSKSTRAQHSHCGRESRGQLSRRFKLIPPGFKRSKNWAAAAFASTWQLDGASTVRMAQEVIVPAVGAGNRQAPRPRPQVPRRYPVGFHARNLGMQQVKINDRDKSTAKCAHSVSVLTDPEQRPSQQDVIGSEAVGLAVCVPFWSSAFMRSRIGCNGVAETLLLQFS
jgi:hypothetical protein